MVARPQPQDDEKEAFDPFQLEGIRILTREEARAMFDRSVMKTLGITPARSSSAATTTGIFAISPTPEPAVRSADSSCCSPLHGRPRSDRTIAEFVAATGLITACVTPQRLGLTPLPVSGRTSHGLAFEDPVPLQAAAGGASGFQIGAGLPAPSRLRIARCPGQRAHPAQD
jgi:hypothetical protein